MPRLFPIDPAQFLSVKRPPAKAKSSVAKSRARGRSAVAENNPLFGEEIERWAGISSCSDRSVIYGAGKTRGS